MWKLIETEMPPEGRIVLLFAVTHIKDDGTVGNWKMATGNWHAPVNPDRDKEEGRSIWTWDGHVRRTYEVQPTHWMPLPGLPASPQAETMPTIQIGDIVQVGESTGVIDSASKATFWSQQVLDAIYRDPLWRRPASPQAKED